MSELSVATAREFLKEGLRRGLYAAIAGAVLFLGTGAAVIFATATAPAAAEGCEAEYSFTDPLIVAEPKTHPTAGVRPQYMYDDRPGFIWCGENAVAYGIRSFRKSISDPALFWRSLVTGDVQTIASARRALDEKNKYDYAGWPIACTTRNTVFYSNWGNDPDKIYYWIPGTDWNPETEKERVLPFPGVDVLPSPDGKRAVLVVARRHKQQNEELAIAHIAQADSLEVIRLPDLYSPHAWLQDSARLLVSRSVGPSQESVRGIFDLGNPEQPFRPFDWPDHFQKLIEFNSHVYRESQDRVDDGGDTYVLRYIRKGEEYSAMESSVIVLDRCRFAADRVGCQPVGKPVELDIGYFHFTHPTKPVLYYTTMFGRDGKLRRYDAESGTDKAVIRGKISYPSPGGRFVRGWMYESFVHNVADCR